jgi:hypothetical protein
MVILLNTSKHIVKFKRALEITRGSLGGIELLSIVKFLLP